jgi:uncharacterized protein (TIGR00251 family)
VIRFNVHVHPGSRTSSVGGSHDGSLNIHVRARAVEGAATKETLAVLAQAFHVRVGAVQLVRGATSRRKTVTIEGDERELESQLGRLLGLNHEDPAKD